MHVGVGFCDHPDSAFAGRRAAEQALASANRPDKCDLVLLFCTARHNVSILYQEVAQTTGNTQNIFGGGAAGIITNEKFAYAGDQVGVVCIWMDHSKGHVFTQGSLSVSENAAGAELGKKLMQVGITPDTPVLLFYDSVKKEAGNARLIMATWLLEGLEKKLGFLPDIMGAGLIGDHIFTPIPQFLGHKIGQDHAFALTFSADIQIDNIILHGCYPASPYYTVTKANGSTILEINGKPAISFINEIMEGAITPEQYPFFLIFGVNHAPVDAEYAAENYASRLCQGIDMEQQGIIMFEPDMVPGTRFQIMIRTQEPTYIGPKIEYLFNRLEGREPLFAFYINCAGRGAGYGGTDLEDAAVIQTLVRGRCPLFGIYSGIEIASIGGKPRGLDWTGVFCLFSKAKAQTPQEKADKSNLLWEKRLRISAEPIKLSYPQMEKLCLQNLAKIMGIDAQNIAIRNELEQKRRAFSLLAELSVFLKEPEHAAQDLFFGTTKRINAALNMQKTMLLLPIPGNPEKFMPSILQGFSVEEEAGLIGKPFIPPAELLNSRQVLLVTGADAEEYLIEFRKRLNLPYFISTPIMVEKKRAGLLITGRMQEAPPFLTRLTANEAQTMQAIAALLASVMVYQKLDEANRQARTDALTGLHNRGALEYLVTKHLTPMNLHTEKPLSAFILIDLDYFKEINDKYGHPIGDQVLMIFAENLRNYFRATDIVSRFGGDEFAVFCPVLRGLKGLKVRAKKFVEVWRKTPLYTGEGRVFYSTFSMGIALVPEHGTTYNELLHKADIALYQVKKTGRNGCVIYDEATMGKLWLG